MKQYTVAKIKEDNLIIFETIMGSHAYGTNMPGSDTDIRGIFIQPVEDILGFGKIDQVADKKNDIIYYEIGRFLDLLRVNNPNIIELLNVPKDCINIKQPIMHHIFDNKDKFLTKRCRWTFGGYAHEQIRKARGLNKKMNWEENTMVRKNVLEFCYVLKDGGSITLNKWFNDYNKNIIDQFDQRNFGLAKVNHAHDIYAMYNLGRDGIGIISDLEKSNDVQLTSIPKNLILEAYLIFNKDAYSIHCKKFKEYQEWLKNRNIMRVDMAKAHGKKYDGKNMNHCLRLLTMANEIAEGKGVIVRRNPEEIKKLLAIRKGEYEYEDLLVEAEDLINAMDKKFESCDLPKEIEMDFMHKLLIDIREEWNEYQILCRNI